MGTSSIFGLSITADALTTGEAPATNERARAESPDDAPTEDDRLDVALDLTFPASDPIPWIRDAPKRKRSEACRPTPLCNGSARLLLL